MISRDAHGRNHVRGICRIDNTGGSSSVDTTISGVQYLGILVELNAAVDYLSEIGRQRLILGDIRSFIAQRHCLFFLLRIRGSILNSHNSQQEGVDVKLSHRGPLTDIREYY